MAFQNLSLADLRQRALAYLGSPLTDNHFGAMVNNWLNDGLVNFVSQSDGVHDHQTIIAVPGQYQYQLPAGFIQMRMLLFNGLKLTPRQLEAIDFFDIIASPGSTVTYPERYAIFGNNFLIGPLPPANNYPIDLFFYREPKLMLQDDSTPEIPNRYRPYLADYAAAMQFFSDGAIQDANVCMERFSHGCELFRLEYTHRSRDFKTTRDEAGYY